MSVATGLTLEEFEKLPQALAHNHELIDGELVKVSGNTPLHNRLRDFLIALLLEYVAANKLGVLISEQEFAFGEDAHGPDIALIGPAKAPLIEDRRRVQPFVPDLAIEIVSPNDAFAMLAKKARKYRRNGTREVWILSMDEREALVYTPERDAILNENDLFSSPQIPGFSIRLGDLFDRAIR